MNAENVSPSPRVRVLDGALNLRDLGGLRTADGRAVRTGRVYRGDYPAFAELAPGSVQELGLRTVVDLRRRTEVDVECVDWAGHGVAYERWPLTAGKEDSWHAHYTAYLENRPETVAGAVRAVMRPEGHGALFHCAAGKDRTGTVAALLLAVLGVPRDDIVADYVLSASSVARVIERLVGMELYAAMLADSSIADQEPRADHMHGLLEWLDTQGGPEEWLLRHGVLPEEITTFRAAMLED